MGVIGYTVLGAAVVADIYATVRAVNSVIRFNKKIKEIDCYDIRKDVSHLAEEIKLRH